MAHVITISFPYCLCNRILTVYWFINIAVKSSSGKTKTYIMIFDIALLVLTKSLPSLGTSYSNNTMVIFSRRVTHLPIMTAG